MLQINGMADHVHLLIGLRPTQSVAELIKEVKEDSSGWINENRLVRHHFKWQEGYGAFTVSAPQREGVLEYIYRESGIASPDKVISGGICGISQPRRCGIR